jgi:BirA family biotin operon repressor/biotin-[acetyl-CoA-carboxylase] ligase
MSEAVQARLQQTFPMHRLVWLKTSDSTHLEGARLWRSEAASWVVVADSQSAGRGRYGRSWESAPGVNIYLSLVWQNPFGRELGLLNLFWGVVVWQSLLAVFPSLNERLTLKWPNDVYVERRKLAGILMQNLDAELKQTLVGIGINVYARQDQIPPTATSLLQELPPHILGDEARVKIVEELLHRLHSPGLTACCEDPQQLREKFWQAAARCRRQTYAYQGVSPVEGTLHGLYDDGTVDILSEQGGLVHLCM